VKIERVVYELWELQGFIEIFGAHLLPQPWQTIVFWYGVLNIVTALIWQQIEYHERKKKKHEI
jgi:hypothetical protein